jgi:hypothetical protein
MQERGSTKPKLLLQRLSIANTGQCNGLVCDRCWGNSQSKYLGLQMRTNPACIMAGCKQRHIHVSGSCSASSPARLASASCSTCEVSCCSRASPFVEEAGASISQPSPRSDGSWVFFAAASSVCRCLQSLHISGISADSCHAVDARRQAMLCCEKETFFGV